MPRFRVPKEALRAPTVSLRGADLRRLRDVLRLGPGGRVELFDGEGEAFVAEVASLSASAAELRVLESAPCRRESPLTLTLAVALAKGAKLDWVVEKATELGVSRIVPFTSERTIPGRDDFGPRLERWRRIATAGAAQSGRARAPSVTGVTTFAGALASIAEHDLGLLFHERGGDAVGVLRERPSSRVLAITGPEGGFSSAETDAARRSGAAIVGLGPRILRAETAAVVAVAICQLLAGDLGAPPPR